MARANGPEDQLGLGSRAIAMGGAGTALANDSSAAYYNPAALAFCPESQVSIDVRHTKYAFRADRRGPDAPEEPLREVPAQTRATVGTCLRLPYHLAAGVLFGTGLQQPATIAAMTPDQAPRIAGYGESLEQLTITFGFAYRPIPELSFGFGGSVIVRSDIAIVTQVPVGGTDPVTGMPREVDFELRWGLRPTAAPYLSVLSAPLPTLKIGLTYRGEIGHHLEGPLDIQATFGGLNIPLPMTFSTDSWYSPRQVAAGVSGSPLRWVTLSGDVTWYNYRALRGTSYPFLELTADNPLITAPSLDPLAWRNVWALRAGAEARVADDRLALRTGYGLRTPMIALPGDRNTTVLDGYSHLVSVGLGYMFGPRAGDTGEEPGAPRARRRAARPGYEAEGWSEEAPPRIRTRIDAYGRIGVMPERHDAVKQLAFGGHFFDAGVTASLGWY